MADSSIGVNSLIEAHQAEIRALLEPHNARSIAVFGSVARGEATVDSDIDFVGEFEPGSAAWAFPLPCSPSLAQGYS
jgi:hypothetical protein